MATGPGPGASPSRQQRHQLAAPADFDNVPTAHVVLSVNDGAGAQASSASSATPPRPARQGAAADAHGKVPSAKLVPDSNDDAMVPMASPARIQSPGGYEYTNPFGPAGAPSPPPPPPNSGVASDVVVSSEAYLLCLAFGWLGAHHFFLGRIKWGVIYLCTLGCLGWGIVVDLFRLPLLVTERARNMAAMGHNNYFWSKSEANKLGDMYALWIFSPLGAHHFYAGRTFHGLCYCATFGLLGVGMVADLFRMRWIAHADPKGIDLFEAYIYLIPCGLFGLHHLYLGDVPRFTVALFTLNYLGFGFVLDIFRLPMLVEVARGRVRQRGELG